MILFICTVTIAIPTDRELIALERASVRCGLVDRNGGGRARSGHHAGEKIISTVELLDEKPGQKRMLYTRAELWPHRLLYLDDRSSQEHHYHDSQGYHTALVPRDTFLCTSAQS